MTVAEPNPPRSSAAGVPTSTDDAATEQHWLGYNGSDPYTNGRTPNLQSVTLDEALAEDPPGSSSRVIRWRTGNQINDDVPEWGWEYQGRGRIQRATLCLLAGRPGAGKSTAARYFAAGFTLGALGGCFAGKPQHVAYIASEESIEYMIKPSLRAHNADMSYVHFPHVEMDGSEVRLSSVADEVALTRGLLARDISIVFVDPVMSAIGSKVNIDKSNQVRDAIEPWARISRAINGSVFGIVHLVKAPGGDVVAAINGSSAFGEVARSVFAFAKDQQSDHGVRVMSQEKNSAGSEDLALEYVLTPTVVDTDSGRSAEVVRFTIQGPSSRRVSDVLQVDPKKRGVASDGTKMAEVLQAAHEIDGPATAPAVAQLTGIPPDNAGKFLRTLVATGLMTKVGRGQFKCRELD